MRYSVVPYKKSEITKLEDAWRILERGKEMTYFQSFDWNFMINRALPDDTYFYETRYVAVKSDDKIVLIAPLFIVKHRFKLIHEPLVQIADTTGWTDYRNFIYQNLDMKMIRILFSYLKTQYGNIPLSVSCIKQDTAFYKCLCNHNVVGDVKGICVECNLPDTNENYTTRIRKSVRQNLRTAINRMNRNEISYHIELDDKNIDRQQCAAIRDKRAKEKAEKVGWRKSVKRWIKRVLLYMPFNKYMPLFDDRNAKVMSICNGDEIMAFFNYGYDKVHREVVVMAAGVNKQYEWYSPGMVLMHEFIMNSIKEKNILKVDFTRGNEKYKYDLGGTEHYISSVTVNL